MRLLKGIAAVVLLLALLVGVPGLLIAWGDPLALMTVDWRSVLLRPADGEVVLALVSILGWLAWALLAVTTIVEVTRRVTRGRIHIHLPGIRWLQPAVGGVIAMILTPVLSGQADEPAQPVPAHAPAVVEDRTASTSATAQPSSARTYVVQPGDELWTVAERELGSGSSWRAIVQLNESMTWDTSLVAGRTILLPSDAQSRASALPPTDRRITVERGDTLWDLAEKHLGEAERWPEIFRANRDRIADPDEIDVGWSLLIPGSTQPATPPVDTPVGSSEAIPQVHADPTLHARPSTTRLPTTAPSPTPRDDGVATTTRSSVPQPSPSLETPAATASSTPGDLPPSTGAPTQDADTSQDVLGPLGGMLAASLCAVVLARRHVQDLHRGVGRRAAVLAPEIQRFFAALIQRSHRTLEPPAESHPTSVILGWRDDSDVLVDLEFQRCTLLTGSQEDMNSMTATVITSLLCAPWSSSVEVVTVQPQEDWPESFDDPRMVKEEDVASGLARFQTLCAQRRLKMGRTDLHAVRADDDLAGAWAPVVFVFCRALQPAHVDRIRDCISMGRVGVSVVAQIGGEAGGSEWLTVSLDSSTTARVTGESASFAPQLLAQPARRALMSLLASSVDEDRFEPAPWWRNGAPPPTVTVLPSMAEEPIKDDAMPPWSPHPDHPTLLVLGPVELRGCHGVRPARAAGQCMEYCAWLLLHPGATPTAMVRELLVAEGTRRSNTSRLRSWLGSDADGAAYLPDAYSGRVTLDAAVTSDWERFQLLLAGGVNAASSPLLREALSLVRGKPLQDVAFQWPWVSQWLTDMLGMIADAAAVLADRCLTEEDAEGALWAVAQGQLATGDDEILAIRRIHALALSGEKEELDRAVMNLTRAARAENRDLAPESVQRIQHALHLGMHERTGL